MLAQQGWESTIPPDFQGLGWRKEPCKTAVAFHRFLTGGDSSTAKGFVKGHDFTSRRTTPKHCCGLATEGCTFRVGGDSGPMQVRPGEVPQVISVARLTMASDGSQPRLFDRNAVASFHMQIENASDTHER